MDFFKFIHHLLYALSESADKEVLLLGFSPVSSLLKKLQNIFNIFNGVLYNQKKKIQKLAVKENNQVLRLIAGSHPKKAITSWNLPVTIIMDKGARENRGAVTCPVATQGRFYRCPPLHPYRK